MALEQKIEKDIVAAMKARDAITVSVLRMVKADLNNYKIDKNKNNITDEETLKIIQGRVKKHKDSIEQFKKGARDDLVQKETSELKILSAYLPEQCSEEALKEIIQGAIKETGATGKKDMGKVIKTVMDKVKGRAEGKRVSRMVGELLP